MSNFPGKKTDRDYMDTIERALRVGTELLIRQRERVAAYADRSIPRMALNLGAQHGRGRRDTALAACPDDLARQGTHAAFQPTSAIAIPATTEQNTVQPL